MNETWKPIKEWEEFYEISNFGNVRNIKTKKLLNGDINNCGYYRVQLNHNGKKQRFFRHRLVATHFIPNTDKTKKFVNHIDGDKSNNTVTNLEWVTQSENEKHAFSKGLKHTTNKPFIVEYENGLTEEFCNLYELSEKLKVSFSLISLWLNGKCKSYIKYKIVNIYYK